MRRYLIIIALAIISLLIGTNGFTQEYIVAKAGDAASRTAGDERINAFMVEKIIGSQVINGKGETLGKIENLVVDIDSGRILYAILGSGGVLGLGDKLFPVPWEALAALPEEGIFFLNKSKEQMGKAPFYNKGSLPDMTDLHWGEDVFKHYGIQGYVGRGSLSYYGYRGYYGNPTLYPGPVREDPYKKIFDSKTIKTISGQVIKVDHVPDPGYGMEMRLTVAVSKKEVIPVYLGPAFYIEGSGRPKYFKMGDKITVTGSQVTVRDETFIIATTVKQGDAFLLLRDNDGSPAWVGWKK